MKIIQPSLRQFTRYCILGEPLFRRISNLITASTLAACFIGSTLAFQPAKADTMYKDVAKKFGTKVKPCGTFSELTLPVITWGADLVPIFGNSKGLLGKAKFKITREDDFVNQVGNLMACKTPFLRGTAGMIAAASDIFSAMPIQIIYHLSWSSGGDALVIRDRITNPKDIKKVALQRHGPHTDYLFKILSDSGADPSAVQLVWTKDLTGSNDSPLETFRKDDSIDAAMMIIPDANAATSGGTVGTGSEDSIKGAKILLSTKSANRVIADVYAVRKDFYEKNQELVKELVSGLTNASDTVQSIFATSSKEKNALLTEGATILLDSPDATADTEGMYLDAQLADKAENSRFLASSSYPRNFSTLLQEAQSSLVKVGLIEKAIKLDSNLLVAQSAEIDKVTERFNQEKVNELVVKKQAQGTLGKSGLFSFEIYFKPNQNDFLPSLYQDSFDKAITMAATYGGAIITIEGHSDPLGYLRAKKEGHPELQLRRIKQAAKNLSLSRAAAVKAAILGYAKEKGIAIDPSQLAVVGYGIENPKTGMCGEDPCAPKSEQEWLDNMRVQFRIIQVEAETSVFKPL